ncbi:MAG: peptide chain release factor H, partial [Flavobacterium sp.]|nr:peptide chain release factor H [Flavobacterium sp.]
MEKIIQITSGRGPEECTWVVAQVLKRIMEEARSEGLEVQILHREPGQENGTVATAT